MNRRLSLRREQLSELTTAELADVAAGAAAQTYTCPDYTYYCITGPAICAPSHFICT